MRKSKVSKGKRQSSRTGSKRVRRKTKKNVGYKIVVWLMRWLPLLIREYVRRNVGHGQA